MSVDINTNANTTNTNANVNANTTTLTRMMRRKFEESHTGIRRPFDDPIVEQLELEHETESIPTPLAARRNELAAISHTPAMSRALWLHR